MTFAAHPEDALHQCALGDDGHAFFWHHLFHRSGDIGGQVQWGRRLAQSQRAGHRADIFDNAAHRHGQLSPEKTEEPLCLRKHLTLLDSVAFTLL
ncbi:MAG: hypothetical protein BWY76_01948 [bacterium ADurb.Bin429]|nr:MAG: hypothetical protein BWY76_01948 [bacterium ADurb.Bin429]